MGHIERTELAREDLLALARTGCYLEYDWFGETLSMYPTGPVNVPSDTERIDQIQLLFAEGHGAQVLASHDVCLKTRLATYGGMGYGHLLGERGGLDAREGHDGRRGRAASSSTTRGGCLTGA